jgi:glycosyltransferase involved in cell wall biosynthesis
MRMPYSAAQVRILVVTDGLEPLLGLTVVGLADRGHDVRVVGALGPDELGPVERFRLGDAVRLSTGRTATRMTRAARWNSAAVGTVLGRTRREPGTRRQLTDRMARYSAVLEEPADVVYFEAANVAAQYAMVLDQLAPKVVMCTGSDVRILPDLHPWLARTLPAVFASMSHIMCRSKDLQEWAIRRGATQGRTAVLYPAVDTSVFTPTQRPPRADDALRLVSVGRLHWVKGYEFALEAVARARGVGVDCVYTIVGADRGARDAIEYAVRDLGLEDSVTLVGAKSVEGVRAALARSDVFVLSSVSEGASRSALEAMAMGLPIVTTDVGGMPEIVEDGVHGIVVARRDADALAAAFGALFHDPVRRRAMGERALAHAQDFTMQPQLDAIEETLLSAAANRRA